MPESPVCLKGISGKLVSADPTYGTPGDIDLFLGAELFWKILREGRIHLGRDLASMQNTPFGYIIRGLLSKSQTGGHNFFLKGGKAQQQTLLGDDPSLPVPGPNEAINGLGLDPAEDTICENDFLETFKRNDHRRFIVSRPDPNSECSHLNVIRD